MTSEYTYYSESKDQEDFYVNEDDNISLPAQSLSKQRSGSRGSRNSSGNKMMISQPQIEEKVNMYSLRASEHN